MYECRLAPLLFVIMPVTAWSVGGHYPVDDAWLPDPGEFGAELWHSYYDGRNSESALSAFWRPSGRSVELIAEFQHLDQDGVTEDRFEPQVKYQFARPAPGSVGAAVIVHAGYESGRVNDWLVNVPFSYEMPDAPVVLHGNLGWIHERNSENRNRGHIGGSFEWETNDRLTVIGQLYREGAEAETEAQLGLRTPLGGIFEHLDLAIGRELTGDDPDRSLTAGMTISF